MSYSILGDTISNTTDTSLAGLSSITGVTTHIEYSGSTARFIYNIGNLKFRYGILKINPEFETLVLGTASPAHAFKPSSSSSALTIGSNVIKNGERVISENMAIVCHKQPTSVSDIYHTNNARIIINQGTLTWWEGTIRSNIVIAFGSLSSGSRIHEGAVIEGYGNPGYTAQSMQVSNGSVNLVIDGLKIRGVSSATSPIYAPRVVSSTPPRLIMIGSNGISDHSAQGQTSFIPFKDYQSTANAKDFNLFNGGKVRGINTKKGSDTIIVEHNNINVHAEGVVEIRKEWQANIKDTSGNAIEGARYFIKDTDNGDRRNALGEIYTNDFIYQGTTPTTGVTPVVDVLTAVVAKTNQTFVGADDTGLNKKDRRSKNDDTTDAFDIHFWNYNHLYAVTERQLKGIGVLKFDWTLFDDPNISETDKAIVDAYTSIDNLGRLYDRAKSWKVAAANVEVPTIDSLLFTGNGTQLLMPKDWSLLGKKDATSVFAVNVATKLITIKATALVGGAKFTNIKCQGTGTVTADTDEDLTGIGIEDANGNARVTLLQTTTGDTLEISIDNKTSWAAVTTNYRYTVASVETIVYFRRTQPDGNVLVRRYDLATTGIGNELVMSYGALETINKQVLDITVAETNAWAKKAADHAEQANIKLN